MNIEVIIAFIGGAIVVAVGASTLLNNYLNSKRGAFITSDMWNETKSDIKALEKDVGTLKEKVDRNYYPTKSDFDRHRDEVKELKEFTDKHDVLIQEVQSKVGNQMDSMQELFTARIDAIRDIINEIKNEIIDIRRKGISVDIVDRIINEIRRIK